MNKQWLYNQFCLFDGQKNSEERFLAAKKSASKNKLFNERLHYPCDWCSGKGYYGQFCGPYDRENVTCEKCKGQRFLSKSLLEARYAEHIETKKYARAQKKEINDKLKQIKAKLSKEELSFLLKHNK